MNFNNKANNMYKIIGRYNVGKYEGSYEVIDTATDLITALLMLDEYISSFGNKWDLDILEE